MSDGGADAPMTRLALAHSSEDLSHHRAVLPDHSVENAAQARPTIRVYPAEGGSDNISHSTSLSHSSDDESSRGSFDLDDVFPNPRYNADKLAQLSVKCTLHITLADKPLPGPDPELVLAINDPDNYTKIDNTSRNSVKERCQEDLIRKELFLRYGKCTIVGQKDEVSLMNQEDWATVRTIITNLLISEPTRALHLDIQGDYFAFQPRASSDISFAGAKRTEIHTLMKPAAGGKMYISRTDLLRVTSRDTIRDVIIQDSRIAVNEKDNLIAQVQDRARKLFAMFVYAGLPMSCLKTLLDRGCTDDDLPLGTFPGTFSDCHPQCTVEFHHLVDNQGRFMAAEFMEPGQHQKFHARIVVPIHFWPTDKEKGDSWRQTVRDESEDAESPYGGDDPEKRRAWCGAGAFSNVYRVRINPSHHRLTENKDADFALKEFKDRPKKRGADFNQELKILNELRTLSQKHIVTHQATWLQDGRYCMLFPYAECNLRQYMGSTPFGTPIKERVLWLLRQFRGLAQALKDIHNLSVAVTSPSGSSLGPQPVGMRKAGYHHDLKPENILSFPKPNSTYSTFKVADFGSGKVNTYRSGSVNTRSPTGTPTYEPPEAKMEGRISRPYDLWSLGCVFLELLIWAAFEYQQVTDFEKERFARRCPNSPTDFIEDDGFWQMDEDGSVTLRTSVHKYIQRLREDFQRKDVPWQRQQSFKAVLELVISMLEPDKPKRILALPLWNTLDNIYKQMKVDFRNVANVANNSVSKSHESQQPDAQPVRLSMEPPRPFAPDLSEDDMSPTAISGNRNEVAHLAVDTSLGHPQRRYSSTSVTPASSATSTQCLPGSMQGSMHGSELEYNEKGDTKPEEYDDDDAESVEETRR